MHPRQMLTARPSSQRGIVTLVSSVAFLFLAALVAIYVSRTALMEQRMSGNEIRHKQAFEAAQAGLDQAMIFIRTTPQGADKSSPLDNIADSTVLATLANGTRYKVAFCDPTNPPAANAQLCPDDPAGNINCDILNNETNPDGINETTYMGTPMVVSCGWSDDLIAHHMVRQLIGSVPPLATSPTNPLTAKGGINVGGSATVYNVYNNLTIWTGSSINNTGNSGKTFVRNPADPVPAQTVNPAPSNGSSCNNPPNVAALTTTDYLCLTDSTKLGPDIIDNDPTLSNLSSDRMFSNYFGRTLQEMMDMVESREVAPADVGTLSGVVGETVVITGNASLSGMTIGSRERPVVLVINGDLDFTGSPTIYGTVYVTGNLVSHGNPKVQGAMVVNGVIGTATGSLDIIYDPFVTSNTQYSGRPGWIPGTWRDWR